MIRPIRTQTDPLAIQARSRVRKPRPFKRADVLRAMDAVKAGGLKVGSVEIRPDGTIKLSALEASTSERSHDIFADWEARL